MKSFLLRHKYLVIILTIYLFAMPLYFGIESMTNPEPIYNFDYPYHYYFCKINSYYKEGHPWSYNPYMQAGFITQSSFNNELMQFFCAYIPLGNKAVLLKIWVFSLFFLMPLIIYFSSINLGLERKKAYLAMIIFSLYVFFDQYFSFIFKAGMFNFIFASMLSLFSISLFYRYIHKKDKKIIIFLCVYLPLYFLMHLSVLLSFLFPLFILIIVYRKKISRRDYLLMGLALILAFMTVILWVVFPFFMNHSFVTSLPSVSLFILNSYSEFLWYFYIPMGSQSIIFLLAGAVSMMCFIFIGVLGLKSLKVKHFNFFFPVMLFFILIAFFHQFRLFPDVLRKIEPLRYIVPLVIYSTIPASCFVYSLIKKRKTKVLAILLFFCILYIGFAIFPITPYKNNTPTKLFTTPPEDAVELKEWIIKSTEKDSRIMIERGLTSHEMYDRPSYMIGLLAEETNRQFLAHQHSAPVFLRDFSSMTKTEIFRKEWDDITHSELDYFFRAYNIKWLIARSDDLKETLDLLYSQGAFSRRFKVNHFMIYETKVKDDLVIDGDADIEIDINYIKIRNLNATGGEAVLKFYWHPALKATKGVQLNAKNISGIPIPFIKISKISNISEFEIYNSYKRN